MNEDLATTTECCLDELARVGEVDKDILIFRVLHRNDHGIGTRIERVFDTD